LSNSLQNFLVNGQLQLFTNSLEFGLEVYDLYLLSTTAFIKELENPIRNFEYTSDELEEKYISPSNTIK
jgi:hypothetical protein